MRGSAVIDLIIFLLVSPLALTRSEVSKLSENSIVPNHIPKPPTRETGHVLVSEVNGNLSLWDTAFTKMEWTFPTNEPIYSSYKSPRYYYNNVNAPSRGDDDFYMDLDQHFNLYNSSMQNGKHITEIVDAWEVIGRLPYTLTDRIILGKKDTSVFLLDWKTGKLVRRYRLDDLYSNSVFQPNEESAVVLAKEAPILYGKEHHPDLIYIERKDYQLQCVSMLGDILWSLSFSEMEAKLQNHENIQLFDGLSRSIPIGTSQIKDIFQLSFTKSAPVLRYRNLALDILDGDGKKTLALPDKGNAEVVSFAVAYTVIPNNTDQRTTKKGFARKFTDLVVIIFSLCVSILSACGLFFCRLRQKKKIEQPSEVPITIPKKKKARKNSTTKSVHKKENGKKDLSFNNSQGEGYKVGKVVITNKEIAKGSNGTVVLEGTYEGRLVAVKRLVQTHHDVAQKEILNLMASDKHPNIVRWYGVDQDEHFIYISLERCDCSLNDLIHASSELLDSPMDFDNGERVQLWKENGHPSLVSLKLMRDIVSGLVHLHDIGIVHRDLKPQNVLIIKNSSILAKLSDMGISKHLPADNSALTRNSTGSGSSGWQAPEQLRNERQTRAVDLFSLGCVLFFCMTAGKHPYGDNYERDVNILNDRKDLFLVESLPEAVHLLTGLLHPDPNSRPRAQEILHHPLFWNSDMRLSFLRDASDRVELENREEDSQLLAALESTAAVTLNGRWDEKLDSIFLDNIGRYRRYKFDSIRDLLRVIRNKLNHYRELPKDLQELLGSVPEGFDRYFSSRFPKLLIQVYTVLFNYCYNEEFFSKYSKTTVF